MQNDKFNFPHTPDEEKMRPGDCPVYRPSGSDCRTAHLVIISALHAAEDTTGKCVGPGSPMLTPNCKEAVVRIPNADMKLASFDQAVSWSICFHV